MVKITEPQNGNTSITNSSTAGRSRRWLASPLTTATRARPRGRGASAAAGPPLGAGCTWPPCRPSGSNPAVRAFAQRLKAKGKKNKVVLVACVRKLAVLLNAMLRDRLTWDQMKAGQIGLAAPTPLTVNTAALWPATRRGDSVVDQMI